MKRIEKKGFTLIELLAVIVILAVIALIAVPIIINVIYKAERGSFENTAYGVIKAGRLYYTDKLADTNSFAGQTFTFPNDIKDLKLSGEKPGGGTLILDGEGQSTLEIYDAKKRWCALKKVEDSKITIADFKDGKCKEFAVDQTPSATDEPFVPSTSESCFKGVVSKDKQQYTITGYTCADKNVVIPSTIGGTKVTIIGNSSFASKGLTGVVIPGTVVTIEMSAFQGNQFQSIVIPRGVTSIEQMAFSNNTGEVKTLKIYGTVKYIGKNAFMNTHIPNVTIPGSVERVGDSAFSGCKITKLTIAEGVISIDNETFAANLLTKVTIPSTVNSIGYMAFGENPWPEETLHITINKPQGTLAGAPWGAAKVDYSG